MAPDDARSLVAPPVPEGPDADALGQILDDAAVQDAVRRTVATFDAPLCLRCLGRPLGRAVRELANPDKGALVHALLGLPFVDDPRDCPWCEGHFLELEHLADLVDAATKPFEFDTILLATRVHPDIQRLDKAAETAAAPELAEHYEPMKTELNRALAQVVLPRLEVEGRFDRADLVALVDPYFDTVHVETSALYLYGRYRKLDRTIPQTKWPCRSCQGKGCKRCDDTGKQYQTSVEELIADVALNAFDALDESFHGSGREDIDALMLGTGRPFVLELKSPRFRRPRAPTSQGETPNPPQEATEGPIEHARTATDPGAIDDDVALIVARPAGMDDRVVTFEELEALINAHTRPRVEIEGLRASDKEEVVHIKEAALDKAYRAHVVAESPVPRDALAAAIPRVLAAPIEQRTPQRVAHRRADKVRTRTVHTVEVAAFGDHTRAAHEADLPEAAATDAPAPITEGDASTHFTLDIRAESGTYIKELLHGDEGRTQPSFAAILGIPMRVVALDVVGVGPGDE